MGVIRSKSNNESLEVYISDFIPRLTAVVLDGFLLRAISEPDLVLPLIMAAEGLSFFERTCTTGQ